MSYVHTFYTHNAHVLCTFHKCTTTNKIKHLHVCISGSISAEQFCIQQSVAYHSLTNSFYTFQHFKSYKVLNDFEREPKQAAIAPLVAAVPSAPCLDELYNLSQLVNTDINIRPSQFSQSIKAGRKSFNTPWYVCFSSYKFVMVFSIMLFRNYCLERH